MGYAPFSHVIVDLDGDGLNDAVVADPATSLVTVLRNELTVALDHRATPRTRFATKRGAAPAPATASLDGVQLASLGSRLGPGLLTRPRAADVLEAASYAGYWYHNDHLGTPQVMTDENRDVVWRGFYRPFGEVVTAVEAVINPFRFPGQYGDAEADVVHNWHRSYVPDLGRFLATDPEFGVTLSSRGRAPYVLKNDMLQYTSSPFGYVFSRPTQLIDPSGLQCNPNTPAVAVNTSDCAAKAAACEMLVPSCVERAKIDIRNQEKDPSDILEHEESAEQRCRTVLIPECVELASACSSVVALPTFPAGGWMPTPGASAGQQGAAAKPSCGPVPSGVTSTCPWK